MALQRICVGQKSGFRQTLPPPGAYRPRPTFRAMASLSNGAAGRGTLSGPTNSASRTLGKGKQKPRIRGLSYVPSTRVHETLWSSKAKDATARRH